MNRPDVKAALHVEASPAKDWPGPPDGWSYTSEYAACNADPTDKRSMIDFYRVIAPRLRKTVVFNGDTDPCVSYEGTRRAIERVGFATVDFYRPWFYDHPAAPADALNALPVTFGLDLRSKSTGAQFGGHVVDYEH